MEISFSLFFFDTILLNGKFPRGRQCGDFPGWPSSSWGSGTAGDGCLISFPLRGQKQLPLTWDIMIQHPLGMSFRISPPAFLVYCSQREARVRFVQPYQLSGVLWEDVTLLGGGPLNMYPHGAPGPLHRAWSDCWGHHATGTKQSYSPCYLPVAPNATSLCQQCPPCHRGSLRAGNEQSQWIGVPLSLSPWQTTPVILPCYYLRCFSQQLPTYPRKIFSLHLFKPGHHLRRKSNNTIWNNNMIADIFKSSELLDLKCT